MAPPSRGTAPAAGPEVLHTGPFHTALRGAIRDRGLTLQRLQAHLARRGIRVAVSTLSLWQQGHSRPRSHTSLTAVRALEEILRLPSGTLVRLLAAPEPTGSPQGRDPRTPGGLAEYGPVAELLDELPGSRDGYLDVLSWHQTLTVDAERRPRLIRSRTVLRAARDGVDRHVLRYFGGPGCDIDQVQVRPGGNCRLGRVRRHPSAPVLVAELLFGQTLRAGDTWVFDDELVQRGAGTCTDMAHAFRQPEAQCLLEARFAPGAVPARCHAYARTGLDTDPSRVCDLTPTSHGTVHLAATDVRAGVLGIRWEWD
jgi:hypothetical protein